MTAVSPFQSRLPFASGPHLKGMAGQHYDNTYYMDLERERQRRLRLKKRNKIEDIVSQSVFIVDEWSRDDVSDLLYKDSQQHKSFNEAIRNGGPSERGERLGGAETAL